VLDAATDNRNRTAGELRFMFSKHDGNLGETGSVGWMFDAVGIIEVDPQGKTEDELTEAALVDGVIDVEYEEPVSFIYTEVTMLASARDALRDAGVKVSDAYLGMRPKQKVSPEGKELSAALAFLQALEDHEDVQHVFSNLDVSEAAMEALA
jgi:transcriptional/translational regulatory protein YebC/TACO1